MKTQDFEKLLRRVAARLEDRQVATHLQHAANGAEIYPQQFRKALQRVETEPDATFEQIKESLVTVKLFLLQPTLAGHLDAALMNRARMAMEKVLWPALLPEYAPPPSPPAETCNCRVVHICGRVS